MESIIYIEMNNSFSLCVLDGLIGKILGEIRIVSEIKLVKKFISNIKSKFEEDINIPTSYEAECLGYHLYHKLLHKNIICHILVSSTLSKSVKIKL